MTQEARGRAGTARESLAWCQGHVGAPERLFRRPGPLRFFLPG